MRIVIFGSSGMVGQGALRECLGDREVGQVLSVVRAPSGNAHEKLHEIVHNNFLDFTPIENELAGLDGCLYCLGVTSTGTSEENYARITYEFTIAAATTLLKIIYGLAAPFLSAARHLWPNYISTTQELGKALLAAAKRSTGKRIVEAGQIRELLELLSQSARSHW